LLCQPLQVRLRATWNKYNLFNLARWAYKGDRLRESRSFFQQKWNAKAITRAYHGEHIGEKKWRRMFSRRLLSAVDMPARYLAAHDGSEQGAGRGSGKHRLTVDSDGRTVEEQSGGVAAHFFSEVEGARMRRLAQEGNIGEREKNYSHFQQRLYWKQDPGSVMIRQPVFKMTPYMQMAYAPLERRLDVAVFRALFASSLRQAKQFVKHGAVKVNGKKVTNPNESARLLQGLELTCLL
jgi:ribosomal protein S4